MMRFLLLVCALAAAMAQMDFNTPPQDKIYLDAFGGDPIAQMEVGAEPQAMSYPELKFPQQGTCDEAGVKATSCSQQCLFECKTPTCSMGCLCGCKTPEAKDRVRGEVLHEVQRLHREMKNIDVQTGLWQKNLEDSDVGGDQTPRQAAFSMHAKHRIHALVQKKQAAEDQHKKVSHLISADDRAWNEEKKHIDTNGFNWDQMKQEGNDMLGVRAEFDMEKSPYAKEANKIDNVYDPTLDPWNVGRKPARPEGTNWWAGNTARSMGDMWWEHVGEES